MPRLQRRRVGQPKDERGAKEGSVVKNRTHVCEPHGKVTILEVVQAPIHHDQTEHEVEPSSAVQEGRQESP